MTWDEGFQEYLDTAYEVRLHRRKNTFGGVLWPTYRHERLLEIALAASSANMQ
ncbi:5' nucleotidase [Microbacterium phage Magritte]|nr:5' nucleotidase [Microbacterium phage Magritte]